MVCLVGTDTESIDRHDASIKVFIYYYGVLMCDTVKQWNTLQQICLLHVGNIMLE